jgi:hypothetical protein
LSKHIRSQSTSADFVKPPPVKPQWGHSHSKSHGNDWPLPALSESTAGSSAGSPGVAWMFFSDEKSDLPLDAGPKKRGPKPKGEPAATVWLDKIMLIASDGSS